MTSARATRAVHGVAASPRARHRPRGVRHPRASSSSSSSEDASDASSSSSPPCPPSVSIPLSNRYEVALRRHASDPFVAYENANGIVNLAECGAIPGGRDRDDDDGGDAPDLTPDELRRATLDELRDLFGVGGVVAEAAVSVASFPSDGGDLRAGGGGFVWMQLSPFTDPPDDWTGEAELWESLLETYGLLLAPGALRGAAEPGWFLCCVNGRDEEALLVGMDRLRTQLLQRKFLHGRW